MNSEVDKAHKLIEKLQVNLETLKSQKEDLETRSGLLSNEMEKQEETLSSLITSQENKIRKNFDSRFESLQSQLRKFQDLKLSQKLDGLKANLEVTEKETKTRVETLEIENREYGLQIEKLKGLEGMQGVHKKVAELEQRVMEEVDEKLTSRVEETKEYLETKISEVDNKFNEMFQNMNSSPSGQETHLEPKKRVQSAAKRRVSKSKKLEEMRKWLEYQRKFTAQEIKKRTEQFKEHEDGIFPKVNTSIELNGSKSDAFRKQYNNVTHPYQSTVDDLMKSGMEQDPMETYNFRPVSSNEVRKNSKTKPLQLFEFDDLDKVVIHKRK